MAVAKQFKKGEGRKGLVDDLSTSDQLSGLDVNSVTLSSPVTVVQVVKGSTEALPEDAAATETKSSIFTDGKSSGIDGTGLWWIVELELVVGSNITGTTLRILEDTIVKSQRKGRVGLAEGETGTRG